MSRLETSNGSVLPLRHSDFERCEDLLHNGMILLVLRKSCHDAGYFIHSMLQITGRLFKVRTYCGQLLCTASVRVIDLLDFVKFSDQGLKIADVVLYRVFQFIGHIP